MKLVVKQTLATEDAHIKQSTKSSLRSFLRHNNLVWLFPNNTLRSFFQNNLAKFLTENYNYELKTSPATFGEIARRVRLNPKDILFVANTDKAAEVAKTTGTSVVVINRQQRSQSSQQVKSFRDILWDWELFGLQTVRKAKVTNLQCIDKKRVNCTNRD